MKIYSYMEMCTKKTSASATRITFNTNMLRLFDDEEENIIYFFIVVLLMSTKNA